MVSKNIFLSIFLIFFICRANTFAQVSIAINFEPFVLNGSVSTDGISLIGASAAVKLDLDSTKSISFRYGIYSKDFDGRIFAGTHYSLIGGHQFNKSLYFLSGVSLYNNNATSSMSGRITNKAIVFFYMGLGVKLLPWLHTENIILVPIANSEIASVNYWENSVISYKVDYIIKINLGIELEL